MSAPNGTVEHYVSKKPFDPFSIEALTPEQEKYYLASQWQLMWLKLKRHKIAMFSAAILLFSYVTCLFTEVISPYNLNTRHARQIYAPPQSIHWFHEGEFRGPFVYGYKYQMNMTNLKREYTEDKSKVYPLRFLCLGDEYEFWNLFEASFHVVCPAENGYFFWLGTDRLGRDMLSRIIHGARISLTIGLIGIVISMALGIIIGGIAGYYGGQIDNVIQRIIEVFRSFPELPLWMSLSAVLPVNWDPILVFFGITVILAFLDWTSLARAVRSRLLALREEDYCAAAQFMGAKPKRVIGRHLLPGFLSHLIASATLSIPSMILGETALSFLGLGLRPPITSWGVLLNEAQNINVVALYPWLMLPVVPVIVVILAFNFFGDGLRDAADPYK
jgi:peptide/nickel transport system permease protein